MTTTSSISIPTAARGKVRAFIKGHANFPQWLAASGLPSRDVKNADLLAFAEANGLTPFVQQIIDEVTAAPKGPALDREYFEAMAIEGDLHRERQADVKADAAAKAVQTAQGAFSAADILKGVEQFLSPLVRKEIEGALAPLVDAANKPPVEVERVVEKTVTVTLDAKGSVVKAARPASVKGDPIAFGKLFGVKGSQGFFKTMIHQWDSNGAAPAIDPFYVVDATNMALLATAAETGTNVWLVGPAGSGKTSMPEQFAAYTGRPFTKIACSRHTEVADLIGGDGAKGGDTFWNDGALIAAMKTPGMVILIDEPTLAPPGVQAIFQNVTDDHRSYTIHSTGEVVKCAPGVVFVVADNTNGLGDETGQYAGTHQANAALVNRFKRMVRVEYMSKSQETTALMNHTGIPQNAAAHVVEFFATARRLPDMEGMVLSLRQMVGLVGAVKDGFPVKVAMETAVLNKLASTERAAIEVLASLDWSDTFEALLTGSPKAVESNTPSTSQASSAFDDEISASLTR